VLIFVAALALAVGLRFVLPAHQRTTVKVRWAWMPFGAALLQVALGLTALRGLLGSGRFEVVIVSYGIIGAWLIGIAWCQAPMLRLPAGLITAGWLLNVVPIVANRGMPVSASALRSIGVDRLTVSDGNLWKHVLATSHTIMPWLGDVVPVRLPLLRNVISVGDIVVLIGVLLAVRLIELPPLSTPPPSRGVPDIAVPASNAR
jgi:hypothetical protein